MKTREKSATEFAIPPLIAWFALFFTLWTLAVSGETHTGIFVEHWRLWVGVAVRALAGAVMPVSAGAVSGPMLLTDGQVTVAAARNLAFALQVVGLTGASTLIVSRRSEIDWRSLGWAAMGCLFGMPLGMMALGTGREVSEAISLYIILWGGFGCAILRWRQLIHRGSDTPGPCERQAAALALAAGFAGGFGVSPVLGAGVALPFYLVLVLLRRLSVRTAINTCILLMTLNSFLGLVFGMTTGGIDHASFHVWLSVAPLACLMVPLGLIAIHRAPSRWLILGAGLLCVGQALWLTAWIHSQSGMFRTAVVAVLAVALAAACQGLVWLGKHSEARQG